MGMVFHVCLPFLQGNNFCDFLFASLDEKPLESTLKGKNLLPRLQILSFKSRAHQKGTQSENGSITSY